MFPKRILMIDDEVKVGLLGVDSIAVMDRLKLTCTKALRPAGVQVALVGLAYFALARAGLIFASPEGIGSLSPASGFYLGVLLITARRRWPAIAGAVFLADTAANLTIGAGLPSLAIAAVDTAEGLLAAAMIGWVGGTPFTLTRVRHIIVFAVVGAGAANAVTALAGAWVLTLSVNTPFGEAWLLWWTADGIGILAVAPVICALATVSSALRPSRPLFEALLVVTALVACALFVFSAKPGSSNVASLLAPAVVPFLLWLISRSGSLASAVASLLVSQSAVLLTIEGLGPFAAAGDSIGEHLLFLQAFFGLAVVTVLIQAAAVTARHQTLDEFELLSRRLEGILHSAADGIFGLDEEGRTTFANPAVLAITGYETADLVGNCVHDFLQHTRLDGTPHRFKDSAIYATLHDGIVREAMEENFRRKDGTSFPVEYTVTPLREDGRQSGAVVVFRDVSERHEVERLKDEFTAVISHELRTPLTSIRGSLGLLTSGVFGSLPEKGQRMLDIAVSNTDRLVRLINDILDIERIESGAVSMVRGSTSAAALMTQAGEVMETLADDAGVTLSVDPVTAELWADPDRIMQTLTNLLANAIKFSPEGATVWLRAERSGEEVLVSVADQGRGIPADRLDAIFERFQQVDSSDSRDKGGTGLGLPICRSIVHQHGGDIWVESTVGEGSTFFFTLPALAETTEESKEPTAGPRIAVVGDDDLATPRT